MKFVAGIAISYFFMTPILAQDSSQINKNYGDSTHAAVLNEVVVTASRIPESILQSPVSIEKQTAVYFKNSASPSFFDALENVKGVQMITPSLGFKVINTRGFANTTNVRFAQLVDGMDIQAPHLGAPIANALGPNDLDIESAEIIPGAASALYGMNTINGLANFITKDPFTSEGVSIQQKTGVNHLYDANSSASIFTETSLRIAHAFSNKFAFKINATFTKGNDWVADDRTDLNATANSSAGLTGADNPAVDPVNGYGNESSNRRTLVLRGKSYVVARTGYYEKQVADYHLQNAKADAALVYKINKNSTLTYTYKFAILDNIYQRANRFRLANYRVQQQGFTLKTLAVTAHAYWNAENTGDSYNLRSMAENMDKAFKSDDSWFSNYSSRFNGTVSAGTPIPQALQMARSFADSGRFEPGSNAWKTTFDKLKNINNWDAGAALRVKANLVNIDGQINITDAFLPGLKKSALIELLAGFDYRTYIVVPDGNYFINPVKQDPYSNLVYSKTGGFIAAAKQLFNKQLKLGATLRVDKNDYFHTTFNPRFSAVYATSEKNSFRISFQSGYRFPSLFEGFSNVNSGGVKRVGGLKVMSNGVFENSWLKSSIDAFKAAVIKDVNTGGLTKAAAIKKNQTMLMKNSYTYLVPEHIKSFEIGYKGLFLESKLLVDVDFYYNQYHSFIAQVEASIAKTNIADSIAFYLNDNKLQDRYRLWTNSKTTVFNYGGSLGVKYNLLRNLLINANVAYAKLDRKTGNDGLEDGFNTPKWITNITLSSDHLYKGIGAGITYKWQSSYYWQSFLVNGQVPAYGSMDVQMNYQFKKPGVSVKLGATNLLNRYYYSFLGGPSIGGLYYSTVTYMF
ncbi:TonB-dependent receptor [Ferruginibacter paludis]|uniref:TonB-dependent receptor n=1 Tax=Ferruginibacter paludis TaxID=1310417 RepID=UPI0025B284EE|nr:TonB-dependent receptor [Ferruginibacter paludis]MDN3657936.1 TonB-dependent receptor [Ferruginibacter paludis]